MYTDIFQLGIPAKSKENVKLRKAATSIKMYLSKTW